MGPRHDSCKVYTALQINVARLTSAHFAFACDRTILSECRASISPLLRHPQLPSIFLFRTMLPWIVTILWSGAANSPPLPWAPPPASSPDLIPFLRNTSRPRLAYSTYIGWFVFSPLSFPNVYKSTHPPTHNPIQVQHTTISTCIFKFLRKYTLWLYYIYIYSFNCSSSD